MKTGVVNARGHNITLHTQSLVHYDDDYRYYALFLVLEALSGRRNVCSTPIKQTKHHKPGKIETGYTREYFRAPRTRTTQVA